MFSNYLNQKCVYLAANGVDRYGNANYKRSREIKCRKEYATKLVRKNNGDEVISNVTVITLQQVKPLDKIDGEEVISVSSMVTRSGRVIGWECYL